MVNHRYLFAYTSPALYSMAKNGSEPRVTSESLKGWIGSLAAAGALFGAIFAGPMCAKFGRKPSLIFNNVTMLVGWLLIIYSRDVFAILYGRFITGFAAGYMSGCVPLYVLEICPTSIRGFFGTGFQLLNTVGILLANVYGLFVEWKSMAVICTVPCVLMPLCLLFVPESPVYLINKYGESIEAVNALRKMRKSKDISAELQDLLNQPRDKQSIILGFDQMKQPNVYKPLLLSLALFFFQQFSGVTAITFYQGDIFRKAGTPIDPNVCAVITCFVQVLITFIGAFFVDKFGRKLLLYISGTGHFISLGLLSFYFFEKDDPMFAAKYGWLALFSLSLFIVSFSIGFGPIPWMMGAEMTPFFARGFITAISICFNWSLAFITSLEFDAIQDALTTGGAYCMFSIASFLSILFVYFCLPETSGKTAEEMEKHFLKSRT
ncbi:facilitated trehalose transporter Tret1-like protein [Leptotrombidium deliense]|uniref:Facilitated trehalose transporter Tret1-like protein n=1 Tax=Leptotrombidium deliense TaxID=299467 RepID=A0A443RZT4_9ACAR|nr:facilitated trehalose transporter Tret1-like protein [Leptotrombidium deliense]